MITEVVPDSFDAISKEIWSSMVNIPLTLSEIPALTSWDNGTVTSSVQIVGSWNGAVCLDMGTSVAHQAAASLLVQISQRYPTTIYATLQGNLQT